MEEIPGLPGVLLPPLVQYRPATKLPVQEWQACLDSWLVSIEVRLRLPDDQFSKIPLSHNASGVSFLMSYFRRPGFIVPKSTSTSISASPFQQLEARLHRFSYLLTKRLLLSIPESQFLKLSEMLSFILHANANFQTISEWQQTLRQSIFVQSTSSFDSAITSWKAVTGNSMFSEPSSKWIEDLKSMNLLVKTLPRVGFELVKGADYLESLAHAYTASNSDFGSESLTQTVIVEHVYRSLLSLLSPERTRPNSLIDQLHLLRSDTSGQTKELQQQQQRTLYSALICETSFLRHLKANTAMIDTKRGRDIIDNLTIYRDQTKHLHSLPLRPRRKPKVYKGKDKGKGKETNQEGEMHIHRASSISQVHELFPHLSTAYILRLLDHFHDNTEAVVAGLLEPKSLPPGLQDQDHDQDQDQDQDQDRSTGTDEVVLSATSEPADTPSDSTLPQRRNVFDNDDFDNLRNISPAQVHRGRKKIDIKISQSGTMEEHNRSKAAIMAALAAFDSDDDERDDTYDVADVGGSVDKSGEVDADTNQPGQSDAHQESLFRAWKDTPELFARDSKTRISPARQQLKTDLTDLGMTMTDEQIEGWAIMLGKDPARQRRLEKKYSAVSAFTGNQTAIRSSKWSASADVSADNTGDESGGGGGKDGSSSINGMTTSRGNHNNNRDNRNRNWGRGRGRGGGGGGGGGPQGANPSFPQTVDQSQPQSQAAKNRSEHARQHGGFRGGGRGGGGGGGRNTRREGRARKMARGGFGGPPLS